MPQELKNVELDEVSLVDTPASPGAKVVLMKRGKSLSTSTVETPRDRTWLSTRIKPKQSNDYRDPMDATQSSMGKDAGTPTAPASPSSAPVVSGPTQSQVHVNRPGGDKKKMSKVAGVKFTIGFPKQGNGGSQIQSVIFDSKTWDKDKAAAWLKDHDMKGGSPDETENTLRYRQEDPGKFARFRVITPGAKTAKSLAAIKKQLNTEDSWNVIQSLVGNALREKMGEGENTNTAGPSSYGPWVKDFFDDYVIYDQDGQTYRCGYTIREDPTGENIVEFENPEPVDTFYMTEDEHKSLGISEENESPALNKQLSKLNSRANDLLTRFQQ